MVPLGVRRCAAVVVLGLLSCLSFSPTAAAATSSGGRADVASIGQGVPQIIGEQIEAAVRSASRAAERLSDGSLRLRASRPLVIPAQRVATYLADIRRMAMSEVGLYVGDLDLGEAGFVIRQACIRQDIRDIAASETQGDAISKAVGAAGGRPLLAWRIIGLLDDLNSMNSSGDQIAQATSFVICEAAG
jgi:hypothetical protein